jgi:hypothetical protein
LSLIARTVGGLPRAGVPQYDQFGGYQRTWIGYRGTHQTLFDLANRMLDVQKGETHPSAPGMPGNPSTTRSTMALQRRLKVLPHSTEDNRMYTAVKAAVASTDMKKVNQHFGAAESF